MTPRGTTPSINPRPRITDIARPATGVMTPSDLTVRLVRSESASLETILSVLYSSFLGFFGVFLGTILQKQSQSTLMEVVATFAFGLASVTLLIWWICVKVKQTKDNVLLPMDSIRERGQ
jgi:hypothetical protein